ncbi:MAG: ABC transporter substrate-binding protein [Clostridiales bacterium]|nr:ABC transporter substrate-binding protein [Clostridiales bacterium]
MKKIVALMLAIMTSLLILASCENGGNSGNEENSGNEILKVGVVQYVSHPSLDNCYTGIAEALTEKYGENIEITRQIGSDSSPDSDCATYAKQFAAQDYDVIVPIATPAATSAFAAAEDKNIPVVFCAVSDPVAAGLVNSMDKPGYNCSGTSDVLDMDAQVNLIRAFQPDVKSIGVVYTTSEANSITQLKNLEETAENFGINIISAGIQNDADIPSAATMLASKVDCINNFTDNKVVNNLAVVLDAANEAGIPVYGSEIEQVKNGCLASVSIDYVALGKVTGNIVSDVLEGAKLEETPVKTISDATPVVNTEVLEAFGLEMPEGYKDAETVTTNK